MKRTLLSVKDVAPGISVSARNRFRGAYWSGGPSRVSGQQMRFDLERVQRIFSAKGLLRIIRPRAARPPAIAGGAHRSIAPVR